MHVSDLVEFFVDVPPRLDRLLAEIDETPLPHSRQEHAVDRVRIGGQGVEIVFRTKDVEGIVVYHDVVYEEEDDDKPGGNREAESHLYKPVKSRIDPVLKVRWQNVPRCLQYPHKLQFHRAGLNNRQHTARC